jgi:hypothetical protein
VEVDEHRSTSAGRSDGDPRLAAAAEHVQHAAGEEHGAAACPQDLRDEVVAPSRALALGALATVRSKKPIDLG